MDDNLTAIGRKIRALLNKTVAAGCTEEEAISAATLARKLMDEHRLSQSDIEIKAEPVEDDTIDRVIKQKIAYADYCMSGISRYCGVRMWYTTGYDRVKRIKLLGLKPDIEMARWLYEMIDGAIRVERHAYAKTTGENDRTTNRRLISSFAVGMASRINSRLTAMATVLEPVAKTASGTALIVVKGALVEEAFAKLNLRFSKARAGHSVRKASAYLAGQAAGDRVNLNRPLAGSRPAGLLN
jgi:hypothetical protein